MKTDNIKVLHISVRSDVGGGPRYIDLLIQNLPARIENFIGCPEDKPYYNIWKNCTKVKSILIIPHRKFSFIKLYKFNRLIKESKIQIIHSSGKGAGLYSRILKIFNPKVKVIHTFHGVHLGEYNLVIKKVYLLLERFFIKYTDYYINVSVGEKIECLKYNIINEFKSKVIYNGTDAIKLKRKGGQSNIFNIVTLSRFDYQKNMNLAFIIAKEIQKIDLNIRFIWIGDGPDKERLENKSKIGGVDNIIFTGFIDPDDVKNYLVNSDIYLSTSRWEGLPFSLIEAMSLGLPIIGTDVTGNNEIIKNNENGYLFDSDQLNFVIEKIIKLYLDKKTMNFFRENSIRIYNNKFTTKIMIKSHSELYLKLLND